MLLVRKVFVRARNHAPNVWAAVEQLIRLLDSANIPVCGGAFGLTSEIIAMINAVEESQKECAMLLDLAAQYARTILDFVDAMQPDYIRAGQDIPAVLARKGIQAFQSDLAKTVPIIKALSRKGRVQRALLRQAMADDIKECERQLKRSHEAFKDIVMNTVVATMQQLALQSLANGQTANEMDQFRIVGASVVEHHELKDPLAVGYQKDATGFWTDLVEAEVANKRSLVKMYYNKSGGEKAFLRDLECLGDCLVGLPRVRAYCRQSRIPFIVLEAESIKPLRVHLIELATNLTVDVADRNIWKTIANLNTAAGFVSQHCQGINVSSLSAALEDARVDQRGQISLAPEWSNDPGLDIGNSPGASELTRDMLEKFLMGDHTFHRLSCISFTFGATTWNYMTREDVLNLSDATSAKAHLCAYAGSASSSGNEERANESYETWTRCSCVSGHMDRPAVNRSSIIPRLSTLVNQAFRLGLSSRVKAAVSDLVDVLSFETVGQNETSSDTRVFDTLSPKVWALLLIADGSSGEDISPSTPIPPIVTTDPPSYRRYRVTSEQLAYLERIFATDRCPDATRRKEISDLLGTQERQTQIWFQNRRARQKMLESRAAARGNTYPAPEARSSPSAAPSIPSNQQDFR